MNTLVFCNYLFCLGNIYNPHHILGQRLIISQEKYLHKQQNHSNNALKIAQLSNSNNIALWKINQNINKFRKQRSLGPDQLSKNISTILENLLKSYEKSQLPNHGKDHPTIVRTNILIRSMGPVSEVDMDYSMDCYFRQYWRDKRLSFKGPKSLSLSIKMLDKIWRPDTYFYNGKHSHIHMITVPNKLLRLSHNGDILYSMRLTIKATCPMKLQSFPMDKQSCPLFIGSYAYTKQQLIYQWQNQDAVTYVAGMTLNQFELISMPLRNFTYMRQEGDFSVLHVSFNLQRHTGYFLIQVYIPCTLIVVLSWVSFWIHREATSDRVGLCITTVLTLSTISIDSRKDLPKVKYATALDWFLLMSFFYCIATLLEFAGVHYFTKIGSGEFPITDDDWEDIEFDELRNELDVGHLKDSFNHSTKNKNNLDDDTIYSTSITKDKLVLSTTSFQTLTAIETQQIKGKNMTIWKQMWFCLIGNEKFRRQREQIAASQYPSNKKLILNSVSLIDRISRIAFPISFGMFNLIYWISYVVYYEKVY